MAAFLASCCLVVFGLTTDMLFNQYSRILLFIKILLIFGFYMKYLLDTLADGDKDHHEHSDHGKNHLGGAFDQEAEEMIKRVKQALSNGEGCRVFHHNTLDLLC